ncbi:competence protein CoiA family protein [Meiothermus granaticius]|uniref:Competence protein CoiA-like family protein n=1 Tax=Meiothermus granaticius NBRC 107808 TaxID=1227551 RepID=A0A399FDL4_9DEIN|nr:competence protein CoiA family protein [Meiothermus granaticius]MCL6527547.1 hypothetical protein [Thermaceae bacterium]RIH93539.1 Competence protein CoiA-like family protein [Meiothermus granaticius NBRC 107808]GEM86035.1 hypothetical protein MGR01S_06600 [Meiothermus granaticius NBRC 107808]
MSKEFAVPFAQDAEGRVVHPLTAPQGRPYRCLVCGEPVYLRRGRKKRAHFAHAPDSRSTCSGESATHKAAKARLREQVERELQAHSRFTWRQHCPGVDGICRERHVFERAQEVAGWDAVEEEVPHGDFRFDVAVTHGGQARLGFEVYFRHLVPEAKAAALGVPWFEFAAEDILEGKPLTPLGRELADEHCPKCQQLHALAQERRKDDRERGRQSSAYTDQALAVQARWQAVSTPASGGELAYGRAVLRFARAYFKDLGIAPRALWGLTLVGGRCLHCAERMIFPYSARLERLTRSEELRRLLSTSSGLSHICPHCGGLHDHTHVRQLLQNPQGVSFPGGLL